MTLDEVRQWARERGVPAVEFRRVYDGALLHSISRLVQAIYRESSTTRLMEDARGCWILQIGKDPVVTAPVSGPLPFRRLEVTASPWVADAENRRPLRTVRAFLAALKTCLEASEYTDVFGALSSDFENSVANVVLNRLMGSALDSGSCALEPAYQGHQYYPLPALRIGPSLAQILECSHLSSQPVALPVLVLDEGRVITGMFESPEALGRAWTGLEVNGGSAALLPVHPWHMALSPIVRGVLESKLAVRWTHEIEAIPLASQRTCRILRTGFDVKLPVNATLTGEHRLLYPLNCENAPIVSALAKHFTEADCSGSIGFQADIASILHSEPPFRPHLSAIVRAPVIARPGEQIVPAINLWTGPREAGKLLASASPDRIRKFFDRYCRALMTGPVKFCSQWGMAFEPHLQNVYVEFRDGLPCGIVLRDLDASILDRRCVQPVLDELGGELAKDTWRHMPDFELGSRRLVQAMLFGHMGEVIACLAEDKRVGTEELVAIVEDTWSDLESSAPSASARKIVNKLRGWSDAVKATLRTRLHRTSAIEFVRE